MSWQQTLCVVLQESPYNPAPSSHLWVWTTDNFLQDAFKLIDALEFRYVRTMPWVKQKNGKTQVGLGQYLRGAHELCLLAVRGPSCLPATSDRAPSVLTAPRGEHSAKPASAYERFERLSPGPHLDIFAREARKGWTTWGDELLKHMPEDDQ